MSCDKYFFIHARKKICEIVMGESFQDCSWIQDYGADLISIESKSQIIMGEGFQDCF